MDRGSNLLLALGEDVGAGPWSVRVQLRPLIRFVWLGGADHGDRRRRSPRPTGATARHARRRPPRPARRGARGDEPLPAAAGVFALLAVVLVIGICHSPDKGIIVSPLLGKPAPQFALPDARRPAHAR